MNSEIKLETVKIISRNEFIRGKSFDVYYTDDAELNLVSVEETTNITDILPMLSSELISDIKNSLIEKLSMRELTEKYNIFTQQQISEGFATDAIKNNQLGWSNE